MSFSICSLLLFVDFVDAMTSHYVRRSVLETADRSTGYSKLDLRGTKRTRRHPPQHRRSGSNLSDPSGSASQSSCVYVFGDDDASEEDEIRNEDVIELKTRNRVSRVDRGDEESLVNSVEVAINEDDTLMNIALRYNCKVSDLKLLNKLIKEQDFYSLRRIRIPVIRHGVLEERLQLGDRETTTQSDSLKCSTGENWRRNSESSDSISSPSHNSQSKQAEQLLLRYDNEIQNSLTLTRFDQSTDGAVIQPPLNRQISKTLNWRTVLTFFIMFCVIIPIIGGLYFILRHLFNTSGN